MLCLLAISSIALFITINVSPFFIHVPAQTQLGITRHQLNQDYGRLLAYLQQPWLTCLRLRAIPLTPRAAVHFQDVRRLFIGNELLGLVCTVLSAWLLGKQKRRGQLWCLLSPLKWLVYLLVLVGWLPVVNFSTVFIDFHQLLFTNRNWIFTAEDPIILLMPVSFFAHLFLTLLLIIAILLILLWWWILLESGFAKFGTDKTNNGGDEGNNDDR